MSQNCRKCEREFDGKGLWTTLWLLSGKVLICPGCLTRCPPKRARGTCDMNNDGHAPRHPWGDG